MATTLAISDLNYVESLFTIILGWVLVALWVRYVENLSYNVFKLNKASAYHAFIVATFCTIVFIAFAFAFHQINATLGFVGVSSSEQSPTTAANTTAAIPLAPVGGNAGR